MKSQIKQKFIKCIIIVLVIATIYSIYLVGEKQAIEDNLIANSK